MCNLRLFLVNNGKPYTRKTTRSAYGKTHPAKLGVTHDTAGMYLSRVRREEYADLAKEIKDAGQAAGILLLFLEQPSQRIAECIALF